MTSVVSAEGSIPHLTHGALHVRLFLILTSLAGCNTGLTPREHEFQDRLEKLGCDAEQACDYYVELGAGRKSGEEVIVGLAYRAQIDSPKAVAELERDSNLFAVGIDLWCHPLTPCSVQVLPPQNQFDTNTIMSMMSHENKRGRVFCLFDDDRGLSCRHRL